MPYLRYDTDTGEILAQHQCDASNLDLLRTEGTDFIEGGASQYDFWVDDGTIKERETVEVELPLVPLMPSETPTELFSGLPADCWVRIRGTENMPYEAALFPAQGGSISFVPSLPGRYVVQLVGRYEAPEFSFEVQPLVVVKERRQAEVTAKKAEQMAGGFLFMDHRWDADPTAQANLTSMANAVNSGMILPPDFYWTSYDNEDVPADAQGIKQLSAAMMTFIFATHSKARQLKDAIEALDTNEAVMNLDLASGWPS